MQERWEGLTHSGEALNIRLAQINPIVGNLEYNAKLIKDIIISSEKFDLLVFPELSLTGYPPQDLLLDNNFIEKTQNAMDDIKQSVSNQLVIIGAPRKQDGALYNSAAILNDRGILGYRDKTLIPSYDVFDENRYFTASKDITPIQVEINKQNISLGVQICEDLWDDGYNEKVTNVLIDKGAEMIINISASPYRINILDKRLALCRDKASHLKYYFIYCNLIGGQDELVYDGQSFIMDSKGEINQI